MIEYRTWHRRAVGQLSTDRIGVGPKRSAECHIKLLALCRMLFRVL